MIQRHYNNLKPQMSKTINKTIGKIWGVEEGISGTSRTDKKGFSQKNIVRNFSTKKYSKFSNSGLMFVSFNTSQHCIGIVFSN